MRAGQWEAPSSQLAAPLPLPERSAPARVPSTWGLRGSAGKQVLSGHLRFRPRLIAPQQSLAGSSRTRLCGHLLPSSLLRLLVSALGDVMPRMPLMEYEEPAESVLTDDTCVTEPVDTVQRERSGQGCRGGRALWAASPNKGASPALG